MGRKLNKLTAKSIEKQSAPGYYSDGGGLYLRVSEKYLTKGWIFRYMLNGKSREMGLGALHTVSLAEARDKAAEARKLLLDKIDPIQARDARRAQIALEVAKTVTFKECAADFIAANRAEWKNAKHAAQWESTLATYVYPIFGQLPVQGVDTALVLKALRPIWTEKAETATRVRARIEAVLNAATALGQRSGDNPARWRGHLDKLLPRLEKRKRVKHHAALPFAEIGAFLEQVRAQDGTAARALELAILTATRTSEVLNAKWAEIDLGAAVWTIPAERMKAHRLHRIPLSPAVVALLEGLPRAGDYLFPGQREGAPLSNMAMLLLLRRMGRTDLTVHGFRSSFRDWTAERTSYPRDVCEMALAHVIGDQTEAAYRRGDLFEKRRQLMNAWATFCSAPATKGEVVRLKRA